MTNKRDPIWSDQEREYNTSPQHAHDISLNPTKSPWNHWTPTRSPMKSLMETTTIAAERLDHQTLEVQLGHLGCHWPLAMQPDLTLVAGARVDLHHTSVGIFGIRPGGICWWGSIQILGSFGVHGKFNRGGGKWSSILTVSIKILGFIQLWSTIWLPQIMQSTEGLPTMIMSGLVKGNTYRQASLCQQNIRLWILMIYAIVGCILDQTWQTWQWK